MLKNASSSLTLRIFCVTFALLIAACATTYAAIAFLTPISYTALLEDELARHSQALVASLEKAKPADCYALLYDFALQTGAKIFLSDENGSVLYQTPSITDSQYVIDTQSDAQPDTASSVQNICSASSEEDGAFDFLSDAPNSEVSSVVEEVVVTNNIATASLGGGYDFVFADGTAATLMIEGGRRAVNQAAEALGRVLPFLIGVILVISLVGSFFYARFITRPIVSISTLARQVATLDFTARWTKRRSDEIGTLGESLNLLSDNLSAALCDLETANASLRQDINRERELERQRLAFFSAASHELKTPITILKGQLGGMLAQVGIYRDREKYLARALEVTGRMEGLVKEILTLSRIESDHFLLKATPVDLSLLMQKQLDWDAELIEQKGLLMKTRMIAGTTVLGDATLLEKVLDNVLMNAILYSPPGASLSVEVHEHSFGVENTGAFIPQEALSRLFEPFYRVEQSRNRQSGGSGLGLYLVKGILSLHGASCRMENTPRGVRFFAQFPASVVTDTKEKGS